MTPSIRRFLLRVLSALHLKTFAVLIQYYVLRVCSPNMGYDRAYYESMAQANAEAYSLLAGALYTHFLPRRVCDVGCGNGGVSLELLRLGCSEVWAFDNSPEAVRITQSKGITNAQQLDLTSAQRIPANTDICLCLEVAEHLPARHSDTLCRLLSDVAPVLVFTAAPPHQGGHLHVNERSHEYWIEHFKRHQMCYDHEATTAIRKRFRGKMIKDYDSNLMIFFKV